MDPAEVDLAPAEWQITAISAVDRLTVVLLALAAAAALAWSWRSFDPRIRLDVRLALLALRLGIILAAIGLWLQPSSSFREVRAHPSRFAILVDNSGSMSLGRSRSRLDRVRTILQESRDDLAALEREHRLAWYSFADDLLAVGDMDEALRPARDDRGTDLLGALLSLRAAGDEEPLVGALLVSDGADTGIAAGSDPVLAAQALRDLGLPVNTLAVTGSGRERDLSISLAKADPFAFSRSETPIAVEVRAIGIAEKTVEVSLWNRGALMQRKPVDMVGGEGRVTFTVRPQQLGQQILTVSVPVPEGDEVPANNTAHVGFEVIRDKLRVLHVAGRPSWDQRFLRDTLRSKPRVDLVSFYVLRTPQQSETFGTSGMSLIPFPTESLFEEHLEEFDVVVFQDFDPALVGVDRYLDAIAGFVERGGGLALVGGADGFASGAIARGALGALLPVRLPAPGTPAGRLWQPSLFSAGVTDAGRRHPVLRLDPDREDDEQLRGSLGRVDGIVRMAGMAESGVALLEHPHLLADDGPAPLLAVREAGEGRTMVIATDSLWRWRFDDPMQGGGVDVYPEFWRRAMDWLVRAPELDRLRVSVSPLEQEPGLPVDLEIELLDEAYRPVPGRELTLEFGWHDEDGIMRSDRALVRLDGQGRYRREWTPVASGPHEVAVATDDGLGASGRFLVGPGRPELRHLDADEALLAAVAAITGGRHAVDTLDAKRLARIDAPAREVLSRRDVSLWDHPLILLALFALLSAEWLLRRRSGMI